MPQLKRVVLNKLREDAKSPVYAHSSDSGADIFSIEDVEILPGTHAIVGTGISVELPEGYEIQVRSKSGMASKHGVFVLNSPGTIDTDYRGEIKAILQNLSDVTYKIAKGDKVAQLVLCPVFHAMYTELQRLEKGFGSTGIKESDAIVVSDSPVVSTQDIKESISNVWIGTDDTTGFVTGMLRL
jgi:dUTP pyrophosphatase